jgi:serine/threonine protein kinase, bacterial
MTLGVSDVFAGYTIIRLLGAGGMGEVYLAQHPRLPRREALKILRHDISTDETFRQRFIREADSIAALEHPNIVTVHDRGDSDDRLWLATQYVDGTDAAKRLRDGYPAGMPADEALTITTAIAEALDYAHDRGLLHRDVKPANILLAQPDRDGNRRAYLADFGIARPLDDPAGLTSTNFTLGTSPTPPPNNSWARRSTGEPTNTLWPQRRTISSPARRCSPIPTRLP